MLSVFKAPVTSMPMDISTVMLTILDTGKPTSLPPVAAVTLSTSSTRAGPVDDLRRTPRMFHISRFKTQSEAFPLHNPPIALADCFRCAECVTATRHVPLTAPKTYSLVHNSFMLKSAAQIATKTAWGINKSAYVQCHVCARASLYMQSQLPIPKDLAPTHHAT